ncbi:hypothetical protein [Salinarimonas ramus]|uniref:Uncharacterized protein n=1 Tax=Salinarimonas ramus TaxID=690164 RepID=A0A917QFZ7_9HYPH|nr:hypothetical protein [Salinarimonas ramus]GGK47232.1 hypothetical protein GCM10011322_37870 [Salinarimonas ramus]
MKTKTSAVVVAPALNEADGKFLLSVGISEYGLFRDPDEPITDLIDDIEQRLVIALDHWDPHVRLFEALTRGSARRCLSALKFMDASTRRDWANSIIRSASELEEPVPPLPARLDGRSAVRPGAARPARRPASGVVMIRRLLEGWTVLPFFAKLTSSLREDERNVSGRLRELIAVMENSDEAPSTCPSTRAAAFALARSVGSPLVLVDLRWGKKPIVEAMAAPLLRDAIRLGHVRNLLVSGVNAP